jgi:hypothetical protein
MPGMLPHLPWLTPEVVIDADVLDAIAADPVRDQEPVGETRHP